MSELFHQWKFVLVIAMLAVAALMVTDKNKLPLAFRGLRKILDSRGGGGGDSSSAARHTAISPVRRFFAFLLVVIAFFIAIV